MTKFYKFFALVAFFALQWAWGQTINLNQTLSKFSNTKNADWTVNIDGKPLPIQWQERVSSFTKKEGIRTFVGYYNDTLVGTIAIHQKQVFGSITWNGAEYHIDTDKDVVTITKDGDTHQCGTCTGGICDISHHQTEKVKKLQQAAATQAVDDLPELYSDGVLRVYRLALFIDYAQYTSFNSSIDRVKTFWASAETFLNELYHRDAGIRFEVVNDERLIITDYNNEVHSSKNVYTVLSNTTPAINRLIGANAYDAGLSILPYITGASAGGMAGMYMVYSLSSKAYAYARPNNSTIAHELGHLFGTDHTFSTGGTYTMNTEPGYGQSVMGYDLQAPRDYFSAASLYYIRMAMLNDSDYYTDEARTTKVGPGNTENVVYGIKTNNKPPILDRSKLQPSYRLPKGTYFQFKLKANDPDGDALLYTAHQVDIRRYETSNAKFRSSKPSPNNQIIFEPIYTSGQSILPFSYLEKDYQGNYPTGSFTFWLGVNDGGATAEDRNHATRYDTYKTVVNFEEGTPFRITSQLKKNYKAGEKVTLQWSVDRNFFPENTKVRILLSDDLGETYKYVLAEATENDGEHTVTIPPITIGIATYNDMFVSGKGVFKIEVIDHIAHTISENYLLKQMAFQVEASSITFNNLPEQNITVKENQIPAKAEVTAVGTCDGQSINLDYTETTTDKLITRTWKANACNETAEFTQYIYVEKNVQPLKFVENLPKDTHIQCLKDLTEVPTLTVTGGTQPKVTFTQTKIKGDYDQYSYHRLWTATDEDAAPISHSQTLIVHDSTKPRLSDYPQDMTVRTQQEIPTQATLTATDNCTENVEVIKSSKWTVEDGLIKAQHEWFAKDNAGNIGSHTQTITVDPNYLATTETASEKINIYPNPIKDFFTLKWKETPKQIVVYDLSGKPIKTLNANSNQQYYISDLPKGVYILMIEGASATHQFKVIKE